MLIGQVDQLYRKSPNIIGCKVDRQTFASILNDSGRLYRRLLAVVSRACCPGGC